MIDPITTISAIGGVLKIVDQVTRQIDRFTHKKPEPTKAEPPHRVLAEQQAPDTIVVKREGKVIQKITAADIAKLDDGSRRLINALEQSMEQNYNIWTTVYPQRDTSPDPVRNAQVDAQLDALAKKMCADLGKLFKYLDSIGKYLEDHYSHIRFVCDELAEKQKA